MKSSTFRTITCGGTVLRYELTRKPVKNINLRVKADGCISVSVPSSVPVAKIEAWLCQKEDWIRRALAKAGQKQNNVPVPKQYVNGEIFVLFGAPLVLKLFRGAKNNVRIHGNELLLTVRTPEDQALRRRVLNEFFRAQCRATVETLCKRIHPTFAAYGIPFPALRFRKMKTCWGSCQPQKKILTFNYALAEAPLACVEYVVWHEFTHFLHPNHSPAFYKQLETFLPDWKPRKERLNQLHPRESEI